MHTGADREHELGKEPGSTRSGCLTSRHRAVSYSKMSGCQAKAINL